MAPRLSLEESTLECSSQVVLTPFFTDPPFPGGCRRSLHRCGEEEAQQYKWIESEKAGRDLGEVAIRRWIGEHWRGFLRHRWLEHLQGKTFWIELDPGDFGLLRTTFQASPLIDPIIDHFKRGGENLGIILWALHNDLPMNEVLEVLLAVDVNSHRIECRFDPTRPPGLA